MSNRVHDDEDRVDRGRPTTLRTCSGSRCTSASCGSRPRGRRLGEICDSYCCTFPEVYLPLIDHVYAPLVVGSELVPSTR